MESAGSPLSKIVVAGLLLISGAAFSGAAIAQPPSTGSGITYLRSPESLVSIVKSGGVPATLQQLRDLETQQQRISTLASACTVNIQIDGHETGSTQGCGVIVSGDGVILTAAHVAERPGLKVKITLSDGKTAWATTRGMYREVDAGLIKLDNDQHDGQPWPHASLGDSNLLEQGMWCVAIGHPGGYDPVRGMVTRVGRILAIRKGSIVTDCTLTGGDSGGPLFDIEGRLIAIHSRIGNDVADNLHIPVQYYEEKWDDLYAGKAWGFLPGFRPILGVHGEQDNPIALITNVRDQSPAANAGIQVGDVIEKVGEDMISNFDSLRDAVAQTMPGKRVIIRLKRGVETKRVIVEIGRDPRFTE